MKKHYLNLAFLVGIMVVAPFNVSAAETQGPLALTGQFTYGSYSGSVERKNITSETLNLSYIPQPDYGISVNFNHSNLKRNTPLSDDTTTKPGLTLFKYFKIGEGNLGGRFTGTNVTSDDTNSDNTFIPYGAIMFKTDDSSKYFDLGYAYSGYRDTKVNQYTLTGGFELFNWWAWAQTRIYYIDLSNVVQGENNTFAVEERLTFYVIPKELSLTLYGLVGHRIFAYDPDLGLVYNLPDIQKGSVGLTVEYNVTKKLTAFGDVTYEAYKNDDIHDSYYGTYGTVGIKYKF